MVSNCPKKLLLLLLNTTLTLLLTELACGPRIATVAGSCRRFDEPHCGRRHPQAGNLRAAYRVQAVLGRDTGHDRRPRGGVVGQGVGVVQLPVGRRQQWLHRAG